SAPLFTLFYFIPELWPELPWYLLLISAWGAFMVFEAWRLYSQVDIPGMRSYEKERPSAAAWFVTAVTIVLLLFPFEYALPVLLGMALVDPLNGDLRRKGSKMYPLVPGLIYLALTAAALAYFFGPTVTVALASVLTTVAAMGAESIRSDLVDDDFLMVVIPALTLAAVFAVMV
ncbi:MAG: hypothetical protein AB7E27_02485, partial [Candidatus Methanomethylophilaceae archaeon]